jgi:Effector Associated Constant Component 1
MIEVRLHVAGYPDSDAEERAELTWRLEQELRELDVEDVSRPGCNVPAGAKGSALEWAQLVVSFAGALPALVAAVRGWQGRHQGASITMEIDGDRLTLTDLPADERSDLLETWMARHGR